jgi:hypothetical protein
LIDNHKNGDEIKGWPFHSPITKNALSFGQAIFKIDPAKVGFHGKYQA